VALESELPKISGEPVVGRHRAVVDLRTGRVEKNGSWGRRSCRVEKKQSPVDDSKRVPDVYEVQDTFEISVIFVVTVRMFSSQSAMLGLEGGG